MDEVRLLFVFTLERELSKSLRCLSVVWTEEEARLLLYVRTALVCRDVDLATVAHCF